MTDIIKIIYKESVAKLKFAKCPSPELDASVILSHVLKKDKAFLITHPDDKLPKKEISKINRLIKKRQKDEPIAYIVKYKEFFSSEFSVNQNVLIPRPESEWLVEEALRLIRKKIRTPDFQPLAILDMGTGSGCLIISLTKELLKTKDFKTKKIEFFASDISKKALFIAKKNAKKILGNNFYRIKFFHSDLFSNHFLHKKYDLIIANLPYVPFDNKTMYQLRFEPKNAIFAGNNGLEIIENLIKDANKYLKKNGLILIELDPRNGISLEKLASQFYVNSEINLIKDLCGRNRYLKIRL